MKKITIFLFSIFFGGCLYAQIQLDDFGRIVINSEISENQNIPNEARSTLNNKLNQITTQYGMGGSQVNPRFVISATIEQRTKDILAGPPQLIALNTEINLTIRDAYSNTLFSSTTFKTKGVGTNENKSLIDAFNNINPQNQDIKAFLEDGKTRIISYYATNCDFIIKESKTLANQLHFDEAIYKLSLVPDICKECYFKCLDTTSSIYQSKIDLEGNNKLNEAKLIWSSEQNSVGAEKASRILMTIHPLSKCQDDVSTFINLITSKLKDDEKAKCQFNMQQYKDKVAMEKEKLQLEDQKNKRDSDLQEKQANRDFELDKIRTQAYRDVAIEFARGQNNTRK